ncbi:MAG TPA: SDR family oxidoreductase [bacterium]|nr:SDR family oxidoreductase [bacterium]
MILVTGGAGFIGSHIVRALLDAGEAVRVLDDLSTGRADNLAGLAVDFVRGDIRDAATVARAVAGVRAVCHHAAMISVPRSVEDPLGSHRINVEGTLNVLEAARRAGVKRFVLASSAAIYGDEPSLPKSEQSPQRPQSPYAVHKLIGEQYLRLYHDLYGMDTLSLRYFNVYGPRQDPASPYAAVIPLFIAALRDGRQPTVFGDGRQTRDFVYVGDVARANVAALNAPDPGGRVVNVAGGRRIDLLELLETLGRIFAVNPEPLFAPERPGDVRHSVAAVEAAAQVLAFRPTVELPEGLAATVAWSRGGS